VALLLKRRGITRIRPLAGGLEGWRESGLPLERLSLEPVAEGVR
jgi:rhodanese-related sulfurtransferase